jgi:hypothetical protein
MNRLIKIANCFKIDSAAVKADPFGNGNINSTYLITTHSGRKYILQKINSAVFRSPEDVMHNVISVSDFLKIKQAEKKENNGQMVLSFIKTYAEKYYLIEDHEYWRMSDFINNSFVYNITPSPEVMFEAGRAFGNFQKDLSGFPIETLKIVIDNFHNTKVRYQEFEKAADENRFDRLQYIKEEMQFIIDNKKMCELLDNRHLPLRVTHNDTKLSNILFDINTKKALCVIDLDTIMPGYAAYDFGDSIRTGACSADENETDPEKVNFDFDRFACYLEGFLSGNGNGYIKEEILSLPAGCILITYEQALRFITDYLSGDRYYKITCPEQNLYRARNQIHLLKSIRQKYSDMVSYTEKLFKKNYC